MLDAGSAFKASAPSTVSKVDLPQRFVGDTTVKIGEMSKSEGDRREDFDDVFDFDQSFVREFAITKED